MTETLDVDDPPFPELSRAQIAAIIARHGLSASPDAVEWLPAIGTVNPALALGGAYVLRVPKPYGAAETRTESVAAPVAHAAGVRTPKLLVFDDSGDIVDVPFTVYERVRGRNFGLADLEVAASGHVYREIGRQLAILHQGVTVCPDPNGYLDRPARLEPEALIAPLASAALLGGYTVRWLDRVFTRLRPVVAAAAPLRRFLHFDVLPTNVMVDDAGDFAALIDWNNAGWADPALDFRFLPSRAVEATLAGYRDVAPLDGDDTAEARVLWDHLCLALTTLRSPPRRENISWARPPFARLAELAAAAARYDAWRDLLA